MFDDMLKGWLCWLTGYLGILYHLQACQPAETQADSSSGRSAQHALWRPDARHHRPMEAGQAHSDSAVTHQKYARVTETCSRMAWVD